MSRWKHKTELVSVGENSQSVRALTQGEKATFANTSRKIAAGEMDPGQLPSLVLTMGCVDPRLSGDDVTDMPADLAEDCVNKILELTGMREKPEKKAVVSSSPPTN